jgi:subtilisin family serine protease
MAAAEGFQLNTQGPAVGICWECRLMPIVVGQDPGGASPNLEDVKGSTAELMAAFLYARDNGAHVANLSSGGDYFRSSSTKTCGNRRITVPKDEIFDTFVTEANAIVSETLGVDFGATTLYTIAGGECGPNVDLLGIDESSDDYFNWPGDAFYANTATRLISINVAATDNTKDALGGLAPYSNFGEPIEIAAPGGSWGAKPQELSPGQVCGGDTSASCGGTGTSYAAPAVAGVAALVVSGSPNTFSVPKAALLKGILLSRIA